MEVTRLAKCPQVTVTGVAIQGAMDSMIGIAIERLMDSCAELQMTAVGWTEDFTVKTMNLTSAQAEPGLEVTLQPSLVNVLVPMGCTLTIMKCTVARTSWVLDLELL